MKYRDFLQKIIYKIINPLIHGMIKMGVTPNLITTVGFIGNLVGTAFFLYAAYISQNVGQMGDGNIYIGWGGAILIFSGLFDMMDGRLARLGNMESTFGALWDSTLDRYSELFSLFGICSYFFLNGWFWGGVITFLAMVGSMMVSYVRARAEGIGLECKVGLMQRPERVVVTAVTAIAEGIADNMWWLFGGMLLIAVLANITAFWRIAYCYRQLKGK